MQKLIAYYFAANDMDGQRKSILKFAEEARYQLIDEFTEDANRGKAELNKALATCNLDKATLAVAALDLSPKKLMSITSILCAGGIVVTNRGVGWTIRPFAQLLT